MAAGPLARLLAQLVVPVVAVLARALPAAYAQALQNARRAGVTHKEATQSLLRRTISRTEALQVLNLTERDAADPEIVRRVSAARCAPRAAAAAAALNLDPRPSSLVPVPFHRRSSPPPKSSPSPPFLPPSMFFFCFA
jgi:hypothetical protein